jgi:mono/diheme cytochrome c family protein
MRGVALAALGILLMAASAGSPEISYTNAQAADGRFLFYQHCAECHGGNLGGNFGPALAGPDARMQWESGASVYAYVSVQMPHGAPGTLKKREYVDIMAFLLQQHGHRAGSQPLDVRMLKSDVKPIGGG